MTDIKPTTRRRTTTIRGALLLAVAAVLSFVVPAQASDVPGKEPPAPRHVPSGADQRDRAIEARAARLGELLESRGGLGVYYDSATSELVAVVPASGRGSDLTARGLAEAGLPARVEKRDITRDTVEGVNKAIETGAFHADARRYTYASRLDVMRGVMVVETDAPAEVVSGLVDAFPGAVEIVQAAGRRLSRQSDGPPHWGGASITNWSSTCSSGFSVQNGAGTRFMVTAGHCFPQGAAVSSPASPYYSWGSVVNRAPFPTWDMELIGNNTYGAYIYVGGSVGTSRRVLAAADPVVGFNNYCHSGQTSFEGCGHSVTSLSGQFCDAAGCTPGLIAYQNGPMLQPGDSGSPFYVYSGDPSAGVHIRGLNIAVSGSTMYAEKWSTVASRFGVSIVT